MCGAEPDSCSRCGPQSRAHSSARTFVGSDTHPITADRREGALLRGRCDHRVRADRRTGVELRLVLARRRGSSASYSWQCADPSVRGGPSPRRPIARRASTGRREAASSVPGREEVSTPIARRGSLSHRPLAAAAILQAASRDGGSAMARLPLWARCSTRSMTASRRGSASSTCSSSPRHRCRPTDASTSRRAARFAQHPRRAHRRLARPHRQRSRDDRPPHRERPDLPHVLRIRRASADRSTARTRSRPLPGDEVFERVERSTPAMSAREP